MRVYSVSLLTKPQLGRQKSYNLIIFAVAPESPPGDGAGDLGIDVPLVGDNDRDDWMLGEDPSLRVPLTPSCQHCSSRKHPHG